MPNYRRVRIPGGSYFFTVDLSDRRSRLLVDRIGDLRDAVRRVRHHHPFDIDAWVVLPDHLHCIWTLPPGDDRYAERWRLIKLLFAKGLTVRETGERPPPRRGRRRIWQPRYWEHTLRSEEDFARHVAYIHFNPVKHGHAGRVRDWPHSTFHRYLRDGLLPPDWGDDVGELPTTGE